MDFRLHCDLHQRANEKFGPTGYDLIHVAGGGRSFLDDDAAPYMLRQVGLAAKLHGTTEIVLVNHEDCGAYGGKVAFANDDEEQQRHRADLRRAADIIHARYPDLKITRTFQFLNGSIVEIG